MLANQLIIGVFGAASLICLTYCPISLASPRIQDPAGSELVEATRLTASVVELFRQGQYEKALPLAKRALEIREKAHGDDDERLRTVRMNLAEVYIALRRLDDAKGLVERVIKSYDQSAQTQPQMAETLERMASIQIGLGYRGRAEELYERAIEINEKAFGIEHRKVGASLFKLAEFYQFTGAFQKAEPLYRRVVLIREKTSSPKEAEELWEARDRLACVLHKLNRKDEALKVEDLPNVIPTYGPFEDSAIAGGVLNGKAVSMPRPSYPVEARSAQDSGTVVVRVVINEVGTVIRACAIKGPTTLLRASEGAAYKATFTPTLLSGKPVKVAGVITYRFVIR